MKGKVKISYVALAVAVLALLLPLLLIFSPTKTANPLLTVPEDVKLAPSHIKIRETLENCIKSKTGYTKSNPEWRMYKKSRDEIVLSFIQPKYDEIKDTEEDAVQDAFEKLYYYGFVKDGDYKVNLYPNNSEYRKNIVVMLASNKTNEKIRVEYINLIIHEITYYLY